MQISANNITFDHLQNIMTNMAKNINTNKQNITKIFYNQNQEAVVYSRNCCLMFKCMFNIVSTFKNDFFYLKTLYI